MCKSTRLLIQEATSKAKWWQAPRRSLLAWGKRLEEAERDRFGESDPKSTHCGCVLSRNARVRWSRV